MANNPSNCTNPPMVCSPPLPKTLRLVFEAYQCGYMEGAEMDIEWNGSVYRGQATFIKTTSPNAGSYFYDIVLRQRDGVWEMENLGCFNHLEIGQPACSPVGMIFDLKGKIACGCSSQGGFEVEVTEPP